MAEPIPRHVRTMIEEALADTRVVLLLGAGQVGKSTLATEIAADPDAAGPIMLDGATTQAAADVTKLDEAGFGESNGRVS